jgi:hypothetical protein
VRIRPALRDELLAHKASAKHERPESYVFSTRNRKPHGQSNFRSRVFDRAVGAANKQHR